MENSTKLCNSCTINVATLGCNCESQVLTLCLPCSKQHFKLSYNHQKFSLSDAETCRTSRSIELSESDLNSRDIINSLNRYNKKISSFLDKLHSTSETLIQHLNNTLQACYTTLEHIQLDIKTQLDILKLPGNQDQVCEILNKYSEYKLSGVLHFYPKYLRISHEDVISAIDKMVYISDENEDCPALVRKNVTSWPVINNESPEVLNIETADITKKENITKLKKCKQNLKESHAEIRYLKSLLASFQSDENVSNQKLFNYSMYHENRYIYIPKEDFLIQFDTFHNTTNSWNLNSYKSKPFVSSSTCVLPNGDVFIVGGGYSLDRYSDEAFIFKICTEECVKLPNINIARGFISCIYRNGIYIFGGYRDKRLKIAEKFDIAELKWKSLTSMQEARHSSSCLVSYDKIYIFLGGCTGSCEEYDIISDSYKLIPLELSESGSVVFLEDNQIYLICKDNYTVFSKDFNVVKSKHYSEIDLWHCVNNVVKYSDRVMFYDNWNQKVFSFNVVSKKIVLKADLRKEYYSIT